MDRREFSFGDGHQMIFHAVLGLVTELRLSEVLTQVVRAASELAGGRDAALLVLDGSNRIIDVIELEPRPPVLSASAAAMRRGSSTAEARSSELSYAVELDGRAASSLTVPIHSRRGFCADLCIAPDASGDELTDAEEEVLKAFAGVASAVIDKAELYEESQQRELWVALQGEIATSLLAGAPLAEILDTVARGARELTDADASTVLLYDGASSLTLCAADGQGLRELVGQRIPAENTLSGRIIGTGEPAILTDTAAAEVTSEPLLSLDAMERALFVPLVANRRTTGTLAVGRMTGSRQLTQTDFWLLESFASHVSMALEYGRARDDLERLAVVEDQERIARDLHDTVIQQLFATGLSLQATAQRASDSRTAERIQQAVDSLDTIIRDIRSAVFALRSKTSGGSDIRSTVRDIATQIFESSDVKVDLHFDGPVDTAIDDDVEQHVTATVREALSNVNRHARASRVDVFLTVASDLVIRVVDDGIGVAVGGRRSSGLLNLRKRAESLGGTMVLATPAAGGTALEWRVPWDEPGRAHRDMPGTGESGRCQSANLEPHARPRGGGRHAPVARE
jgi:signal transduction histidine kinase